MTKQQTEIQEKLVKKLLDFIVLQLLNSQPMHGYAMLAKIQNVFGVSIQPSVIYPLLTKLENKGYISNQWIADDDRPKKVYSLTSEGRDMFAFAETVLSKICEKSA